MMKFKLKSLVVAAALSAVAVSAQAEITGGSSSELFFSAWDGVNGYTFDLTSLVTLNNLVGGSDLTVNATNNATTISRIPTTYAGTGVLMDVELTGFGASFSSVSGVEWNLAAFDATGRRRFISTRDNASVDSLASNNEAVALVANTMNSYASQANTQMADMTAGVGTDSYANTVVGDLSAYAGNYGSNWVSVGDSTNAIGDTSSLFFYAQSDTTLLNDAPLFAQLGLTARTYQGAQGEWRLELASATTAVPEPESYAMMLAGLAMLGGAARRRKNKA